MSGSWVYWRKIIFHISARLWHSYNIYSLLLCIKVKNVWRWLLLSADLSISCIKIVHLICASYYGALWEVVKWKHKGILSYGKSWRWFKLGNSNKNTTFIMVNYFHIPRNFLQKIKCDVDIIAHASQYGSRRNVQRVDCFW